MATVGITDSAQCALHEIKFIYLPKVGCLVEYGDIIGIVESIKVVSEIYTPASGKIVEVNYELLTKPDFLNENPYNTGWVVRLKTTNLQEELKRPLASGQ